MRETDGELWNANITLNQLEWEKLHTETRHRPQYPSESVIRFIKSHTAPGDCILDVGCGAGRHVVCCARERRIPYGIDYSESGVRATIDYLREEGFNDYISNVCQGSCEFLPYEDEKFDAIISYGVLYYLNSESIEKAFSEIGRVIKKDGWCLLVTRSLEDYRYNTDTILSDDPNGCIISVEDESRSAYKENGMRMHFFEKEELKRLLKDFTEITTNTYSYGNDNDTYFDVDYVTICQKK